MTFRKPIGRMQHGIGDWLLIPVVAASPYLFGFNGAPTARSLAWIAAGVILLGVAATRAEWGIVRVIPYTIHLMIDAGLGLLILAAPVLFGFWSMPAARNTFLVLGAGMFAAGALLSRPEELPSPTGAPRNSLGV